MLSAVANFLFGTQAVPAATTNRPEETEVDYEVNEAEDWLLVDVSDREDHDYDTVDDVDDMDEEEDVLSSVPEFLSSVTVPYVSVASVNESSREAINNEESWLVTSAGPIACIESCDEIRDIRNDASVDSLKHEFRRWLEVRPSLITGLLHSVKSIDLSLISCLESSSRSLWVLNERSSVLDAKDKKNVPHCFSMKAVANPTPYPHKMKHNKHDRRVRHPAEVSGAFINHQPQYAVSKVELLEQIKQLKPAQQAKERDSKRYIKKSQMDRQNRTIAYESTNKNRRRRDFYNNNAMRRSGANNNRKC